MDLTQQVMNKAMFDGVWSDDTSKQLESATMIKKLLSQKNIPAGSTETVIQSGVLPRLVEFLTKEEFPPLQYEAAWVVTNIAADDPDVVVDHGAVPNFVKLLRSPKDYVREQAIWALGNVAGGKSKHREHVLQCGVLEPLMMNLLYKDTKLSTLRIGTWTLTNLCHGTPPLAFDEVKPALEQLLYSDDEEVLKYACLAFWYLSYGENEIQCVIDTGFVPRLVEILQHPSPAILATVIHTIGTIVSGDTDQTQYVIDCGALPILYNVLTRTYENNKIKIDACWTISNITAGTQEQIQSVINANLIPPLVNLAQSAEFEMKKEAAWVISNATVRASQDQIKYMVEQSCIKPLCDILLCQDITTILKCLDGLENILKAGEVNSCYPQLIEDVEGLEKIQNLQHHGSNEIYQKALKILKTNWLEEDDEETQQQPPR